MHLSRSIFRIQKSAFASLACFFYRSKHLSDYFRVEVTAGVIGNDYTDTGFYVDAMAPSGAQVLKTGLEQ